MKISLCGRNLNLLIKAVKTVHERFRIVKTNETVLIKAFGSLTFDKNLKDVTHTFF